MRLKAAPWTGLTAEFDPVRMHFTRHKQTREFSEAGVMGGRRPDSMASSHLASGKHDSPPAVQDHVDDPGTMAQGS